MTVKRKPKLLTIEEAATFLGGVAQRTIFRWAARGVLKPVRLEGRTFLLEGDLGKLAGVPPRPPRRICAPGDLEGEPSSAPAGTSSGGRRRRRTSSLITIEGTVGYLGVSKRTVFRWVERGILKPIRIEGRTFLRGEDLEELLAGPRRTSRQGRKAGEG